MISFAFDKLFQLIFLILLIYCLLTWIPQINWYKEPFRTLRLFSEIFFSPFRKIIPPLGMLDISPIVAFIVLYILKAVIVWTLGYFGL